MKTIISPKYSHTLSAMIHKSKRLIPILVVLQFLVGCDDFSQVDMPITELNTVAVFEDVNTANAALANIYAKIRDNGMLTGKSGGISKEMGLYTDELKWYGDNISGSAYFYNNTMFATQETIADWWNNAYSQIYAANALIEGVSLSEKLLQKDKDQLIGEATFARALLHFYLTQLYGDVPYLTGTDYTINKTVARQPITKVYSFIIEDLEKASLLLPENYKSPTRTLPNSYVAKALLARVHLFAENWAEAANTASAVLNNTEMYTYITELNDVFLKESPTTIWQYAPRSSTRNTDDGTTFIFSAAPPKAVALTSTLMDAFEPNDLRKSKWTNEKPGESQTFYHAYKYKKTAASSPQLEFTVVIRLAEMYLIRAEARARQGELINAKDDLNKIRNRAGLSNSDANNQQDLLKAILKERRVEFFTEFGHRFMDLKRFDLLDSSLSDKTDWSSNEKLLPLPQSEINLNPNLGSQNPGY